MYSTQIVFIIFVALTTFWLTVLTIKLKRVNNLIDSLTKVRAGSLRQILTEILKSQKATKSEFSQVYKEIERIDKEKARGIQNVGVVYYKPFGEDEGENSFSFALLDKHGNGILVTGIATRNHARVLCKDIQNGKSKKDLSLEEKHAIAKALKI